MPIWGTGICQGIRRKFRNFIIKAGNVEILLKSERTPALFPKSNWITFFNKELLSLGHFRTTFRCFVVSFSMQISDFTNVPELAGSNCKL